MTGLHFRWLIIVFLVSNFVLGSISSMAQPDDSFDEIEIALQKLGIIDATDQLNKVIEQTVKSLQWRYGKNLSQDQLLQLEQLLKEVSGSKGIKSESLQYVAARLPENIDKAMVLLNDELFDRVANFDASLEMRGTREKLDDFEKNIALDKVDAKRVDLLQRLDNALQVSAIAAMIQTEIAITADDAAMLLAEDENKSIPTVSISVRDRRLQLRQQHMAKMLLTINLYSYRFIPFQQLKRYVELLEGDSIQFLVSVGRQSLFHSLLKARENLLQDLNGRP